MKQFKYIKHLTMLLITLTTIAGCTQTATPEDTITSVPQTQTLTATYETEPETTATVEATATPEPTTTEATTTTVATTVTTESTAETTSVPETTATLTEPIETDAPDPGTNLNHPIAGVQLALPGGTLPTIQTPAVTEPQPLLGSLLWQQESDPVRRTIMEQVFQLLDGRNTAPATDHLGNSYDHVVKMDILPLMERPVVIPEGQIEAFSTELGAYIYAVMDGDARFFDYDNTYWYTYHYNEVTLEDGGKGLELVDYTIHFRIFDEYADPAAYDAEWTRIENEVNLIANTIIARTDNQWQRLRLAHDYLIQRVDYDAGYNDRTNNVVYALFGDTTMCQGYSHAFQLIATALGFHVECIYGDTTVGGPTGDGMPHLWNKILVDDAWYNLDVTFSDPIGDAKPKELVTSAYFLRSDAAIDTHIARGPVDPAAGGDYMAAFADNNRTFTTSADVVSDLTDYLNTLQLNEQTPFGWYAFYHSDAALNDADIGTIIQEASRASTMDQHFTYWWNRNVGITEIFFTPNQ